MENDRVVAMSIHIQSCCALGFGLIVGAQYSADRTSEFETHFSLAERSPIQELPRPITWSSCRYMRMARSILRIVRQQ
jgi:hypothetical protein